MPFGVRPWRAALWGGLALILAGCGSKGTPPPTAEQNIQKFARVYGQYVARNQGRAPASIDELKKFLGSQDQKVLTTLNLTDVDSVFVSPRDNEPYVLVRPKPRGANRPGGPPPAPGSPPPGNAASPVVAHEKTGSGGKRYVVFADTRVEEVDEERFKELIK
jgi:hypothetical protein